LARVEDDLLAAAEGARRDGNALACFDLAQQAIKAGRPEGRFRYLSVHACAQMGDQERAESLYRDFGLGEAGATEDELALLGRLHKDRGRAALPGERDARFRASCAAYLRAFYFKRGFFPAINAAATGWASGDVVLARDMAKRVLEHPHVNPPSHFFAAAARAEALLLLDRRDEAHAALREAVSNWEVGMGERASTFRQLHWLCDILGLDAATADSLLAEIRPPPLICFDGPMFMADTAGEARLAARIERVLDETGARIGYGMLACGADILMAEALLARGGELQVVLPFAQDAFIDSAVRPGGSIWLSRFEACLNRAAGVTYATRSDRGAAAHFEYGSDFIHGAAGLRARQLSARVAPVVFLKDEGGMAGTFIQPPPRTEPFEPARAIALDGLSPLAPHPVTLPNGSAPYSLKAIIATDFQGYSSVPDSMLPEFNREILGRIGLVLDRFGDKVESRKTMGDACLAIVDGVLEAAEITLATIESLRSASLGRLPGFRDNALRIGLHYGPVFRATDPIRREETYYGGEISLAARIEPTAIPGQIYTTQAFAAILTALDQDRFDLRYLGRLELAKGFGVFPIYRLDRRRPAPSSERPPSLVAKAESAHVAP
jgi:class 3 adenylate cyclase